MSTDDDLSHHPDGDLVPMPLAKDLIRIYGLKPWQLGYGSPPKHTRWRAPFVRAWLKLTRRW